MVETAVSGVAPSPNKRVKLACNAGGTSGSSDVSRRRIDFWASGTVYMFIMISLGRSEK
jgi:hypothetical protein